MSTFKPGDLVICVDASTIKIDLSNSPRLIVNNTYEVQATTRGCCAGQLVNVGLANPSGATRCHRCGKTYPGRWHRASRFRPLLAQEQDQLTAIEEQVA